MVHALGTVPVSLDSARAHGLGLGAPHSGVLGSEYRLAVPVRPEDPAASSAAASNGRQVQSAEVQVPNI